METRRFLRYELMERGNMDHDQVEGGVFCRAEWKGCKNTLPGDQDLIFS